jgi:hypothetical protein
MPSFRRPRESHDFSPSFPPVHGSDAQFQRQRACATKNWPMESAALKAGPAGLADIAAGSR